MTDFMPSRGTKNGKPGLIPVMKSHCCFSPTVREWCRRGEL